MNREWRLSKWQKPNNIIIKGPECAVRGAIYLDKLCSHGDISMCATRRDSSTARCYLIPSLERYILWYILYSIRRKSIGLPRASGHVMSFSVTCPFVARGIGKQLQLHSPRRALSTIRSCFYDSVSSDDLLPFKDSGQIWGMSFYDGLKISPVSNLWP